MKIADALYTYGVKDSKLKKIIAKIKHSKKVNNLYVVTLPLVNDGILEIYSYNQLLQPIYISMSDDIFIVGISKGKDGALSLVLDMVQDMYDTLDGEFNTKQFFAS